MSDVKFTDYSVEIKSQINKSSLNLIEKIASEIESQAIRNTRADTGDTKKHWRHYTDDKGVEAVIGNDLINAVYEEFGTGEYAINKDGRNTPWYVPVEGYTGKKKPTFNGKVEVVQNKDGVKFYKTNGKKPTRAFTKAFETVKTKAEKMAEETFGGIGK